MRILAALGFALSIAFVSARPAAAQSCTGDCGANGQVEINELIIGVNIALGSAEPSACSSFDQNESGEVEINELITAVGFALNGCPTVACLAPLGGRCVEISPGPDAQDELLTALLEAQPKDVIYLKEGTYTIDSQLSLEVDDVTIRGQGIDKTILDFSTQTGAAEGLLVQGNRFVLQDIALQDAPGDIVKILGADGVTIQRVRTEWTGGALESNGSYGLYPVQCRSVLIEDSVVKGASDAGIYVGQSRNIVVRNNRVELNVAGVEIENSTDADVHGNTATNNTGGILVFNLPGPPVQDGRRTRVYDNDIFENNTHNFAPAGNTVAGVPDGTGSMILANDQVEVFGNRFRNNNTSDVILVSYNTAALLANQPAPDNPDFDPYSETIWVHDNTYEGSGTAPDSDLDVLDGLLGLPYPNILFDGDVNPAKLVDGALPAALRICAQEPEGTTFANIDLPNVFAGLTKDISTVDCAHAPLSPVPLEKERRKVAIAPGPNAQDELLTALIEAQPGDDIVLAAGTYTITESLSLNVDHVILRGAGEDQTILDCAGITSGGECLLVMGDDFTIRDMAFINSPGDQVKMLGADGVRIQGVRAEWTNGPDTNNGSYGLYPVQCKDVLIEDSIVKGASDAGLYIGQSRNIIVRRNYVEGNVAGIEIENSTVADVYGNDAYMNTGGILVFNLPGLPVYGERTRVFNNTIRENNEPNFAPAGNIVGTVPTGTGIFVLANDQVEIFGNTFTDNDSGTVSFISYNTAQFFGVAAPNDPNFDPFSESLYIYNNTYNGGGTNPDPDLAILLLLIQREVVPQVTVDGDVDPDKLVDGTLPAALRTCVQDNQESFVNLNLPEVLADPPTGEVGFDPAPFDCALSQLRPVSIPGVQ
ncbi:MAG: parallel beta-helix domain-containing protein [Deltaproteobacteria bacterium]|nr:parallel beta-helix domain-containing protein [Deltaproteobacteria bacterium]